MAASCSAIECLPMAPSCSAIERLPPELLVQIFNKLHCMYSLLAIPMVCKLWREAFKDISRFDQPSYVVCLLHPLLEVQFEPPCACFQRALCRLLESFRSLEDLQLHHSDPVVWEAVVRNRNHLFTPRLKVLILWLQFPEEALDLSFLSSASPNLELLSIGPSTGVSELHCKALPRLTRLTDCNLGFRIDNESAKRAVEGLVSTATVLKCLRLRKVDVNLELHNPSVNFLELHGCKGVVTVYAPKLRSVELTMVSGRLVTPGEILESVLLSCLSKLEVVSPLNFLRTLEVAGDCGSVAELASYPWSFLGEMPRLECLRFFPSFPGDDGQASLCIVEFFMRFPSIRELSTNLSMLRAFRTDKHYELNLEKLQVLDVQLLNACPDENDGLDEEQEDAVEEAAKVLLAAAPNADFRLTVAGNADINRPPSRFLVTGMIQLFVQRNKRRFPWPPMFDYIPFYEDLATTAPDLFEIEDDDET